MKVYGKKVLTKAYPCRFPDIQSERKEGGFQIEIVVPKAEASEVNDLLYGDDEKVINFNKASAKAKTARKLWSPIYVYDREAKEYVLDDEGEKIEDEDFVLFRFKSQWRPKIQFKKGLDNKAKIGAGSVVQISGSLFGSDEKLDENGKALKYVLLSLAGVRVHELVLKENEEVFEESDEFDDEDGVAESADKGYEAEAPEGQEDAENKSSKNF